MEDEVKNKLPVFIKNLFIKKLYSYYKHLVLYEDEGQQMVGRVRNYDSELESLYILEKFMNRKIQSTKISALARIRLLQSPNVSPEKKHPTFSQRIFLKPANNRSVSKRSFRSKSPINGFQSTPDIPKSSKTCRSNNNFVMTSKILEDNSFSYHHEDTDPLKDLLKKVRNINKSFTDRSCKERNKDLPKIQFKQTYVEPVRKSKSTRSFLQPQQKKVSQRQAYPSTINSYERSDYNMRKSNKRFEIIQKIENIQTNIASIIRPEEQLNYTTYNSKYPHNDKIWTSYSSRSLLNSDYNRHYH